MPTLLSPTLEVEFTALTWNLHKGRSTFGFQTWQNTLNWLKQTPIDLCFLQETFAKRFAHHSIKARRLHLDREIWHCQATNIANALNWNIALGPNVFKSNWRHGNAILSSHPLRIGGRWNISAHRFERRGLLVAHVTIQDVTVTLLCVHLSLTRAARIRQIHWLKQWITQFCPTGPLILAGDFNDWRDDAVPIFNEIQLKEVAHELHEKARTFPALSPSLALDKMFVRDILPIEWIHPSEPVQKLSDHLPYIAKLKTIQSSGNQN